MTDDIQQLLEQARVTQPDAFQRLVQLVRDQSGGDVSILVAFAGSDDELKRRVALAAAAGRTEPEVVKAITSLAYDPLPSIRQGLAYALTDNPSWKMDEAAKALLHDVDSNVRQAAVWAAKVRPAVTDTLVDVFLMEGSAWVRNDMANAMAECDSRKVLFPLVSRLMDDTDAGVQQSCAYAAEKHLTTLRGYPADLARPAMKGLVEIRRRLATFTYGTYPALLAWLNEGLANHVDVDQLAAFGTVLTVEAEKGQLPRAYCVDEAADSVLAILDGAAPRAVVLVGEPGSGKTAVVQEITHRLLADQHRPGYVLRMAPQDFLAGTKYIGEWETKVRNVIAAAKPPRRVILYIPNIEELAWMGTWEKSDASVATALAPYIERGDLTILGESTVEGFRKGLGANRSLRRLFHAVELTAPTPDELRFILKSVAREAGVDMAEATVDRLSELADYFVAGAAQPGRSVGLLRRVLSISAGKSGPITEQDILSTISTSTGIPVNFLDDTISLDRSAVRAFFEARVMGQPEAVDAVVDLVTLVKAGLTDPNKPFGIFLFVGPTGVGKTELARALAEHLFGDPARLVRLDMSEFATYEAYERLIGGGPGRANEPGLLTATVREHPFAVLLFDEIEKAHPNIYNLCLQMFDAGRLTDTQGRTADFRRTIIIMTSNVGSSIASEAPVGFGRKPSAAPDRAMTMRELGRWFRPEFLNRLDRIVNFRPLAMETAEKIAQREVARVLERGGLTRRNLLVDVDPGVLPVLLREGYSPAFGARPLKRTIERLVLLPAARVIAEGKAPPGSLLRLVAKHDRVDIEVELPDSGEAPPPTETRAEPVAERADKLLAKVKELAEQAEPLTARKSELLAQTAAPGLWEDPARSRRLYDEIYRLDGILTGLADLEKKVQGEVERARRSRHSERELTRLEEHLDGLAGQAEQLAFLVSCRDSQALGDALVTVRLATRQGKSLDAVPMLARMYQNLATRRGLECQVVDDRLGGEPKEDTVTLLLSGPGAFALLAGEDGSHQVTQTKKGEGKSGTERETIRVEVLPVPLGEIDFAVDDLQTEVRSLDGQRGRLLGRINHEIRLFHVPTMTSVRSWCDGPKSEAIERIKTLLCARLDAQKTGAAQGGQKVIRRYRLAPTPLVRDQRTGQSTGRLDQVLEGHLDMFLRAGAAFV